MKKVCSPVVAAAELSAHVGVDHPDLVERQVQHLGDVHARLVGLVVVGPAGELVVLPVHEAAARVEAGVVGAVVARGDLDDHVAPAKPASTSPLSTKHCRARRWARAGAGCRRG